MFLIFIILFSTVLISPRVFSNWWFPQFSSALSSAFSRSRDDDDHSNEAGRQKGNTDGIYSAWDNNNESINSIIQDESNYTITIMSTHLCGILFFHRQSHGAKRAENALPMRRFLGDRRQSNPQRWPNQRFLSTSPRILALVSANPLCGC